jgi:hypothetical protein
MRRVGFFREMEIAGDDHPSLRDAVGTLAGGGKERIVGYLEAGCGVVMAPTMVGDALEPSREAVAGLGLLTDGEWIWPAELEYYVEEYDVGLPRDFIDHMAANEWTVPTLSVEDLTRIADEVAPST